MVQKSLTDHIHLHGLEVRARVGVPEAERKEPQRLILNITLWPSLPLADGRDEISATVDYAKVCEAITKLLHDAAFKLIETVAAKVASHLLESFELQRVMVEVRKFILPETEYVSVSVTRERGPELHHA